MLICEQKFKIFFFSILFIGRYLYTVYTLLVFTRNTLEILLNIGMIKKVLKQRKQKK